MSDDLELAQFIEGKAEMYWFKTVLMHLTSCPGYDYNHAKVAIENPVPIVDDDYHVVGHACLYEDTVDIRHPDFPGETRSRRIVAEAAIIKDSPARLSLESRTEPLYLVPAQPLVAKGRLDLLERRHPDVYGAQVTIDSLGITCVGLTREKPSDPRILPIGEVL